MFFRKIIQKLSTQNINCSSNYILNRSVPVFKPVVGNMSCATSCTKDISSFKVPAVDIDPQGVFKYILLKVYQDKDDNPESYTTIVRGYQRCNYHSDIYDEVQDKLHPLDCEPIGGGRISHEPDEKKIHIYGYSQGYGKADHTVTAKIVKKAYPDYTVTISDEGY